MFRDCYMKRLTELMNSRKLDAVFVNPSEILKFLTGVNVLLCERFQGLFLTRAGDLFYIVSVLNGEEIKEALEGKAEVFVYEYEAMDAIRPAFEKYGLAGARVAVNSTTRAMDVVKLIDGFGVHIVDGNDLLCDATAIKTEESIEKLAYAARMTDKVYEMVLNTIRPGMTEGNVMEMAGRYFKQLGITESFGGGVSFGKNTALPHYIRDTAVLQEQDIVLMDFGCKYQGFHSDMTRTFFIGDATPKQREVYATVLQANLRAEAGARAGMTGHEIDAIARDYIAGQGYGDRFIHRLGHGVGSSVHEHPVIGQGETRPIENGMVFSIEPGRYFEAD